MNALGDGLQEEPTHVKRQRVPLDTALNRLSEYFDKKDVAVVSHDPKDIMLAKVDEYSKKMNDDGVLCTMSPDTKDVCLATLKKRRKHVVDTIKEADK